MKKTILLFGFIIVMINIFGQSQGLSYQAVIISNTAQQIPGNDIQGNIVPNHTLKVRFTILDVAGTIDYQEEQTATTDSYGLINLIIGQGTTTGICPHYFNEIDWSGENKDLKVDISLDATNVFYTDFSYQQLLFVPYAYHKNITATGTMAIDGATTLKNRLDVTNQSPAFFTGDMKVDQTAIIDSTLTVNNKSNLNGQVTIKADVNGDETSDESYPLRVEGSNQGIVIKVDGSRSNDNNYITFRDDENIQGRIEGESTVDLLLNPEYIYDNAIFAVELIKATIEEGMAVADVVAASTSSTPCAGLGVCVTAPIPSLIADAIASLVLQSVDLAITIAEPIAYNVFKHTQIGVTYQSGSGDYAEWLPKRDVKETFNAGEIIGVKDGHISKSTDDADHYLVISTNPIVLGNMPEQGKEGQSEKVAFMGQVPVKVWGKVKTGDYILPGGNNNGIGIAVSPDNMEPGQYQKIVGVAWSENSADTYGFVNVAVGLQANDIARLSVKQEQKIEEQKVEIANLKNQIDKMNSVLAQLLPDYASQMSLEKNSDTCSVKNDQNSNQTYSPLKNSSGSSEAEPKTIYYYEISESQVEEGIALAENILKERGIDLSTNPFFSKINTDPVYKKDYIYNVVNSVNKQIEKDMKKDMQTGTRAVKMAK